MTRMCLAHGQIQSRLRHKAGVLKPISSYRRRGTLAAKAPAEGRQREGDERKIAEMGTSAGGLQWEVETRDGDGELLAGVCFL
ncbi:hypothetical protein NDU88_002324 [Pleurodeles waltl]|uniref:Uncharacterized protein n=1 Tax=Pleurodeles waltl TaxID=8319 RepID=A0AAV7NGT5_PLEWA|nr:hypothetical protein NDU88_002324 [Pleurodeles waltl]